MLEHPIVLEINMFGYPKPHENESAGTDFFGTEIFEGDEIVEHEGEVILKDNLEQYLAEQGFQFKIAE